MLMHSSDTLRNTSAVRHGAIANMQDVHVSVDMSDLFIQYILISRAYPLTYVHLIQVYGTLGIISHIHIQYIYIYVYAHTHMETKETTTHAYHALFLPTIPFLELQGSGCDPNGTAMHSN